MGRMKRIALAACVLAAAIAGCKAKPAKTTAFLGQDQTMGRDAEIQMFHKLWYKADADWTRYKKIHVPPVDTKHLRTMTWWEKSSLKAEEKEKDLQALAEYMRSKVVEAQRKNTHKNRLIVVDRPDAETVVMELALTEVVPTKAWLNALSMATMFMTLEQGTVAFEGRVRDGQTKEIIAKFADREQGKANALGNVKDFGWHGHAKAIINEWADQLVLAVNWEEGQVIEDSPGFELKVW